MEVQYCSAPSGSVVQSPELTLPLARSTRRPPCTESPPHATRRTPFPWTTFFLPRCAALIGLATAWPDSCRVRIPLTQSRGLLVLCLQPVDPPVSRRSIDKQYCMTISFSRFVRGHHQGPTDFKDSLHGLYFCFTGPGYGCR